MRGPRIPVGDLRMQRREEGTTGLGSLYSATATDVIRETLCVQMAFGSLVRCNHGLELFHSLVFSLKKPRRKIRELGA